MDILFRYGRASATEVQEALGEPITNAGVRGMLRHLGSKGYVTRHRDGRRYMYAPADRAKDVSRSAVRHLVSTFFRNSRSSAIAAVLEMGDTPLTEQEYERLADLLARSRGTGETEEEG